MHGPYRVIRNAPYQLRRWDTTNSLAIAKDGNAEAVATNTPTETPGGSSVWSNELTVSEMTADFIMCRGSDPQRSDVFLIPEPAFDSGVAQAGAATTITLRAGAPSFGLTNTMIEIVRGTGKDQQPRLITAYDTTTKVATVRPDWSTNPDNTSVYIVTNLAKVNPMQNDGSSAALQYQAEFWGTAYRTGVFAASCTTTVLQTNLTGIGTNALIGAVVMCLDVSNIGICRPIIAYDTATGQITVNPAFPTAPSNLQRFAVFGYAG